jgi:hypothetical protein
MKIRGISASGLGAGGSVVGVGTEVSDADAGAAVSATGAGAEASAAGTNPSAADGGAWSGCARTAVDTSNATMRTLATATSSFALMRPSPRPPPVPAVDSTYPTFEPGTDSDTANNPHLFGGRKLLGWPAGNQLSVIGNCDREDASPASHRQIDDPGPQRHRGAGLRRFHPPAL